MTKLGYTLSSEEFDAPSLVAQAERAEQAGFSFASVSDHFHPWIDEQGESPFVWGTLGAISQRTERIELIRRLWGGELTSHRGEHFTVENARIYSLPDGSLKLAGEKDPYEES